MNKLTKNITFWMILSALLGYYFSYLWGDQSWLQVKETPIFYQLILWVKSLFISALKMMIAPIVFFSLLGGILNIKEITKLKKMGLITIGYYLSTTAIAICIGLIAVFFIHPWENSDVSIMVKDNVHKTRSDTYQAPQKFISEGDDSGFKILTAISQRAFSNPFESLSSNNILGIVTASLLIGLALISIAPLKSPLSSVVEDINATINKILSWLIRLTPVGLFAIAFDFQLKTNGAILEQLFNFALLVFGATMIHGLIILPSIAWLYVGVSPKEFFTKSAKALLVALSTASSSATLPISMQTCEEEFNVSEGVSGFVFPLGATMNMDGTALFEGIAAVFLAHLYGIELSTFSTFSIFFMAMISSIGAPGMPSASMSGMQIVLLAAGIPLEAIGILLVIDKPLDTFRTAVNVEGDMIGALVTQKYIDAKTS